MLAVLFSILFQIIPCILLVFLVPLNTELMFAENDPQRLQDYFSALKYLIESPQLYIYVWVESYSSLCIILHLSSLIFICHFNSLSLGIASTFSRSSTNNSFEYPEQYCVTSKLFHFIYEAIEIISLGFRQDRRKLMPQNVVNL